MTIPKRGQRVNLCFGTVKGYNLLNKGGTLWQPCKDSRIMAKVVEITPDKFYQNIEPVTWVKVKWLDITGKYKKYKYAQLYYDQITGRRIA